MQGPDRGRNVFCQRLPVAVHKRLRSLRQASGPLKLEMGGPGFGQLLEQRLSEFGLRV